MPTKKTASEPHSAPKIADVVDADAAPASPSGRPLVRQHKMLANDPMVTGAADVPPTAPLVSRQARTVLPVQDLADTAAAPPEAALAEEAPTSETPTEQPIEPPEPTQTAPEPEPEPEPSAESVQDAEAGADKTPAPDSGVKPPVAQPTDAEIARLQEAAAKRQAELDRLVESRQYFVPVNAVSQRRNIRVSLAMTVLLVALSLLLIDLMLDANIIELIQKLPHTHFFSGS